MADRATRILLVGIFVLLVAIAARLHIDHPLLSPLSDSERSIVEIFERVSPSVVRVSTITGANDIGIGSGFIWDASGNIVTNEHVVQGAATIAIWYASSEPLEDEVVGVAQPRPGRDPLETSTSTAPASSCRDVQGPKSRSIRIRDRKSVWSGSIAYHGCGQRAETPVAAE